MWHHYYFHLSTHAHANTNPQNADHLKSAINIVVSRASTAAIARIEALGGSVTTRFYSPASIRRVLKGESHPVISLQADADLIARTAKHFLGDAQVQAQFASSETTEETKQEILRTAVASVSAKYKYRLPDATGRKDIEYYRDPAHRGYLAYTVKEGESPSLFFKPPGEAKDRKKQQARRQAAKVSAENRLF
jgi:large subunit ribosomal protein L15